MTLFLQLIALGLLLVGHQVFGAFLYNQQMSPDKPEWSYHNFINGPEQWCNIGYSECCKKRQSPVNINVVATKYSADHLTYENYDIAPDTMELHNNGHTVVLTSNGSKKPSISFPVGGSVKQYSLDNVHFHWGKVSSRGSEHTVDEARFPMEMHFVHKLNAFQTLLIATESNNNDSIAVIGVFFEISKHRNPRLNTLIDSLKLVQDFNTKRKITPFNYNDLMPHNRKYFFSYGGSLTTPPCTENVQWVVLDTKVPISEEQIDEFRQLREETKDENTNNAYPIVDNYRPLQELNGRHIYISNNP